mmetsp:Transcript_46960/g.87797  ORF Transcript_46960/g.87797 Transcript_46960/m.87797 type:complete len:312 (+) Transcript_46960:85-1020(+)
MAQPPGYYGGPCFGNAMPPGPCQGMPRMGGPPPMQGMPGGCPPMQGMGCPAPMHGMPGPGCPPRMQGMPGGPPPTHTQGMPFGGCTPPMQGMPPGPLPGGMPPGPCGGWQAQGWGAAMPPPSAEGFAASAAPGPAIETFVEVSPEVEPAFRKEQDGTFTMQVPRIRVRLSTTCTPPPTPEPGLAPFKPYEEFFVDMPELAWVVFNPWTGTPPGGTISAQTRKRGAVLEVSPQTTMHGKLKANSPYGTLAVEDKQVVAATGMAQTVQEALLNYSLKVEGTLSVNKGGGNCGSNRLEVDLAFFFTASVTSGLK